MNVFLCVASACIELPNTIDAYNKTAFLKLPTTGLLLLLLFFLYFLIWLLHYIIILFFFSSIFELLDGIYCRKEEDSDIDYPQKLSGKHKQHLHND